MVDDVHAGRRTKPSWRVWIVAAFFGKTETFDLEFVFAGNFSKQVFPLFYATHKQTTGLEACMKARSSVSTRNPSHLSLFTRLPAVFPLLLRFLHSTDDSSLPAPLVMFPISWWLATLIIAAHETKFESPPEAPASPLLTLPPLRGAQYVCTFYVEYSNPRA